MQDNRGAEDGRTRHRHRRRHWHWRWQWERQWERHLSNNPLFTSGVALAALSVVAFVAFSFAAAQESLASHHDHGNLTLEKCNDGSGCPGIVHTHEQGAAQGPWTRPNVDTAARAHTSPSSRFVVVMDTYQMQESHISLLLPHLQEASLRLNGAASEQSHGSSKNSDNSDEMAGDESSLPRGDRGCDIVPVTRSNDAVAAFPTDFVAVKAQASCLIAPLVACTNDAVQQPTACSKSQREANLAAFLLASIPSARAVHVDSQVKAKLKSFSTQTGPASVSKQRTHQQRAMGRRTPQSAWAKDAETDQEDGPSAPFGNHMRLLARKTESFFANIFSATPTFVDLLEAPAFWEMGHTGKGVKVAIFDTGIDHADARFANVEEVTNWTNEDGVTSDKVGHGTFVAGVVASRDEACPGLAPDAELHIFRVFNKDQISFTSWFLDAFNYAIFTKVDILNLSIGGPDFGDVPFVQKVNEVVDAGIVMVSAIGNDGPLMGTLNNPGDQDNVVGVGGIDYAHDLAKFSSRGMTLWELPYGYGRVKPDVVTYGVRVRSAAVDRGCRELSGTSVASPVVTGALALLLSALSPDLRDQLIVPAVMKQALHHTSVRIGRIADSPASSQTPPSHNRQHQAEPSIFEQGAGAMNLTLAAEFLDTYSPHISAWPATLDTTDCPYFSPLCEQPLFHTSQPLIANLTLINPFASLFSVASTPTWTLTHGPTAPPEKATPSPLDVAFQYRPEHSSWTGNVGVFVRVSFDFSGVVAGIMHIPISSSYRNGNGVFETRHDVVDVPFRIRVRFRPPRAHRLLVDTFHSIHYPAGYFPRDAVQDQADPLDWNGDHPHTNYLPFFRALAPKLGVTIELLREPLTCVDGSLYRALIIADPEDDFYVEEKEHLYKLVDEDGVGLVVLAEWYSKPLMEAVAFFDDNTQNDWFPETGGSNLPALNDVLGRWGISFSSTVAQGRFRYSGAVHQFESGATIANFPEGGVLVSALLRVLTPRSLDSKPKKEQAVQMPIIGLYNSPDTAARIAVYGDTTCIDAKYSTKEESLCADLVAEMVEFVTESGDEGDALLELGQRLSRDLRSPPRFLPERHPDATLHLYSRVLSPQSSDDGDAAEGHAYRPLAPCSHFRWVQASVVAPEAAHVAVNDLLPERQGDDGDITKHVAQDTRKKNPSFEDRLNVARAQYLTRKKEANSRRGAWPLLSSMMKSPFLSVLVLVAVVAGLLHIARRAKASPALAFGWLTRTGPAGNQRKFLRRTRDKVLIPSTTTTGTSTSTSTSSSTSTATATATIVPRAGRQSISRDTP